MGATANTKSAFKPIIKPLMFGLSGLLLISLLALWLSPKPTLFSWQTWSTAYFDRQGNLLRLTLADDDKYRLKSPLTQISPHLTKATLLYEDQYFFEHPGVHVPALWRAFWSTYVLKERQIGASTISMQLARIAFGIDSSTLPGKFLQMAGALWIERHYTKQQILEAYLNRVPYGGNIEGVYAASLIYFQKKPSQLNPAEAMALAVIPQNPSKRNPVTASGYQAMTEARARLFDRWQATSDEAETNPESLKLWMSMPLQIHTTRDLPFHAPHFIEHLRKTRRDLNNEVITSLSLKHQTKVERWTRLWLQQQAKLKLNNAGAILLNHRSMEVEAWLGSANFFNNAIEGQVDIVTAKRSPGSTLKPFVYGLALEQGIIHPKSLLKDTPSRYAAYTPENYDLAYAGPISATDALISSRNVPAVRLTAKLKDPGLYDFLKQANITEMRPKPHYGLSLALGGMEVTMLEMAQLYAVLANQGEWQPTQLVVLNARQKAVLRMVPEKQLMQPESAWLTEKMLQQNPATDETGLDQIIEVSHQQKPIAWKTGTSFAFRDAWAAGFDDQYVLIVWLGHFNSDSNPNLIGRSAAGPLFFNILRDLQASAVNNTHASAPSRRPPPENVKQVDICSSTGALPGRFCPRTEKGWFIPGVSPITVSDVYREIPIVTATGKRACYPQPERTHMKIFEFWPSDVLRLFQMAGIQRKQPPPFEQQCDLADLATGGTKPVIQSPLNRLIYQIANGKDEVPLQATVDADVEHTYWFLNQSYLGQSHKNKPFFWKAKPGYYQLTAVDDRGLSDAIEFEVRKIN